MMLLSALFLLQSLSVVQAWIPAPGDGAASVVVHVSIENPTMYDVFVVSASSDVAGEVELREPDGSGGTRPASSFAIPAYGVLELGAAGPRVLLKKLKRQLKGGDAVVVTLATDGGERLRVDAVVK
jgi:copper(I)-binding protein